MLHKNIKSLILLPFFALFSCTKLVTDQNFAIKCYTDLTVDENTVALAQNVVGYGFFADTANYEVTSYKNAIEGKLSSRVGAGVSDKERDVTATFEADSAIIKFSNISREGMMILLLCDTDNEIFAYREFEVAPLLDSVRSSITFETQKFAEKADTIMIVNGWITGGNE